MEKTFIDNYLLVNYAECLHFFSIERLGLLNPLEQCFLADILVKSDRSSDAKRILANMTMRRDQMENNNRTQMNLVFDTVLNLNM